MTTEQTGKYHGLAESLVPKVESMVSQGAYRIGRVERMPDGGLFHWWIEEHPNVRYPSGISPEPVTMARAIEFAKAIESMGDKFRNPFTSAKEKEYLAGAINDAQADLVKLLLVNA